jgi:hypothetical protein
VPPTPTRPIFTQNPLKLILFNQFSGTMSLNNLCEINKLYEMMKESMNTQMNLNNNGFMNVNYKYQQNNIYQLPNGYYFINEDKSKNNENNNIILDSTYNSDETITKKNNQSLQIKKPIFAVLRKHCNYNFIYTSNSFNYYANYNQILNNNIYNPLHGSMNNNINNNININENNLNFANIGIENHENIIKNINDNTKENIAYQINQMNNFLMARAAQYQGQEEFVYNMNEQYLNQPMIRNTNNKEEKNESENEEGDGYFKRLEW